MNRPVVTLMQRLSYPARFLLIGTVSFIALSYLSYGLYSTTQNNVDFSAKERLGVAYLKPLGSLLDALLQRRYLLLDKADAGAANEAELTKVTETADQAVERMHEIDRVVGVQLGLHDAWVQTRTAWRNARNAGAFSPAENLLRHSEVIEQLLRLMVSACDNSNLTLDPDIDTYYLMDSVCVKLPTLMARTGEARALTAGGLAGHPLPPDYRTRLIELRPLIRDAYEGMHGNLDKVFASNPELEKRFGQRPTLLRTWLKAGDNLVEWALSNRSAAPPLRPEAPHREVVIRTLWLQEAALHALDELITSRVKRHTRQRDLYLGAAVAAVLLTLNLFMALYRSITLQLGGAPQYVEGVVKSIAQGALDTAIQLREGDRDSLLVAIQEMRDRLRDMVKAISKSAEDAHSTALRMSHLALHDALTDLPNRLLLHDRATQQIQHSLRTRTRFALLFMDLDQFKLINDSMGHAVGDFLLQSIARRLVQNLRSSDTVCRQGGDEFIILLPQVSSAEQVGQVAKKLMEAVAEPLEVEGKHLTVASSVGIAIFPNDGSDVQTLMRHADTAMYEAKRAGRGRFQYFSSDMDRAVMMRHSMVLELRRAVESGELAVYYQPKLDLRMGRVIGCEALLRWFGANGQPIQPGEFIPVAEESGLIVPLGRFVLSESCRQCRLWQQQLGLDLPVAVNISAAHFSEPGFLSSVVHALGDSGLPARSLQLEITETILMGDAQHTRSVLEALQAMGITIALDDFGTGYSSLSYLKRFPVDAIKIDQSFVRDMLEDSSDQAIVAAIVRMGQTLGIEVIAEGVETQAQADHLLSLQCHLMQGFLFAKAMPPEQMPGFVRQWQPGIRMVKG